MTPHRDRGKGTFRLDRRLRGVGRICIASGTTHAPTFRRLNEMLGGLQERGRLDLLRAIRDGQLAPLQVYEAYRVGELDRLPTAETMGALSPALTAFVEGYTGSPSHKANMKSAVKHITRAASSTTTLAELPAIVRALRATMKDTPRMYNVVKATAQAFVRERYGKASKLWFELAGIQPLKVRQRVVKHPATPEELNAITQRMENAHAAMAWSLAETGMRPKEYWGEWKDGKTYVTIHGTKTKGAERKVPRPGVLVVPQCWYGAFRKALAFASDGQMTPYDLRRTYANWLEDAGIPRTRRRLYLGHSAKDTTDLYEWRELEAHLEADGRTLSAWLDAQLSAKSRDNSHVRRVK